MRTLAPPPGRFSATASPPCARATARTIASPSPAPPRPRAGSPREKRSKAGGGTPAESRPRPRRGLHLPVHGHGAQADGPLAVRDRVVHEVAEGLLEAQRVRHHREARRRAATIEPPGGARGRAPANRRARPVEQLRATADSLGSIGSRPSPPARSRGGPRPAGPGGRSPRRPRRSPPAAPPRPRPSAGPARARS